MKLEVIYLSEDYRVNRVALPKLPFVLDSNGRPHQLINEYLRDRAIRYGKNIESTVSADARNIVKTYNELYASFLQDDFNDMSFSDSLSQEDKLHELWLKTSSSQLRFLKNKWSKVQSVKNSTINSYITAFVYFLWWSEKTKKYTKGLVGINAKSDKDDGAESDESYRVNLEPAKSSRSSKIKAPFHIPFLLTVERSKGAKVGLIDKTNKALQWFHGRSENEGLSLESNLVAERDYLMMRVMRESKLRVSEMITLKKAEFLKEPVLDDTGNNAYIRTSETKGERDSRIAPIPLALFEKIREYIEMDFVSDLIPETRRSSLTDEDLEYIFLSTETGKPLKRSSVYRKVKIFGLTPHDIRRVGLTELAVVLQQAGIDKATILFMLGETAGHSAKSEGKTIEEHYLLATELVKQNQIGSLGTLKAQILEKDAEIEELRRKVELLEQNVPS